MENNKELTLINIFKEVKKEYYKTEGLYNLLMEIIYEYDNSKEEPYLSNEEKIERANVPIHSINTNYNIPEILESLPDYIKERFNNEQN